MSSIDVNTADFETQVLKESHNRPVVVDFWAPWCGPCRALGPVLEALAKEDEGRWLLTKINIDDNQEIARQFRIQSIPAVKAFKDGKVCEEFVGAMSAEQIRMWIDLFVPGPADELLANALHLIEQHQLPEARQQLDSALELKPRHERATFTLAQLEHLDGNKDASLKLLKQLEFVEDEELTRQIAQLKLQLHQDVNQEDTDTLRQKVADEPENLDAKIALGLALSTQQPEEALETLLSVIKAAREEHKQQREEARKGMLEIFDVLGMRHETTTRYRSQLSQALFR